MSSRERAKELKSVCSKIVAEGLYRDLSHLYEVQVVGFFSSKDGKNFSRGCAKLSGTSEYCESIKNQTKDAKCFFCETDLCNSSNNLLLNAWLVVVATIVICA